MILRRGSCPKNIHAPICVKVRIKNVGVAGDGHCQLGGTKSSPSGPIEIWGQSIELTGMASGAATTRVLPWLTTIPDKSFGIYCYPGLSQ
jgi:hypothetical protein